MDDLVFVYGTLKDPEVQKNLFGRVVSGDLANLPGYSKFSLGAENHNYFDAVPHPFSFVKGQVIKVSPQELKLIDLYETKNRRRVKLTLDNKETAWVYLR